MRPVLAETNSTTIHAEGGEFFIPDLCAPQPVFVMVLLSELMVLVYALASSVLPHFNWDLFATGSIFVQWIVLVSAGLLCSTRNAFSRLSLPIAALASLLLVLAVTALSSYLALKLFPQLLRGSGELWWLLRNLLVALLLAGILLRYFYLQQQLRLQEKLELQARLDSLRSRIRPHFLFNTLNSIASLIVSQPQSAEQAVEDLAELFRASLKESRSPTTVADELRLCELYLGIEQLRLGERLGLDWQVDDEARQVLMPSLVLQPLVENAVYHGIARLPEGGAIRVVVQRERDRIKVTVENPVPSPGRPQPGNRMALANIEQRLQALYGAQASLEVTPSEHNFRVDLSYPVGQEQ